VLEAALRLSNAAWKTCRKQSPECKFSCFAMKGCVWREGGWWRLISSAVSLLKSGGLVWAPLVACETEMGAAMHGCLILMPARAASDLDLKTIDRRAVHAFTLLLNSTSSSLQQTHHIENPHVTLSTHISRQLKQPQRRTLSTTANSIKHLAHLIIENGLSSCRQRRHRPTANRKRH
jgi:hypothetical protein